MTNCYWKKEINSLVHKGLDLDQEQQQHASPIRKNIRDNILFSFTFERLQMAFHWLVQHRSWHLKRRKSDHRDGFQRAKPVITTFAQ